jgi:hypothetical protein
VAWIAALTVALLPIVPTPLPVVERAGPRFFATDAWRRELPRDAVVLPVPGWEGYLQGMEWGTATGLDIRLVGGYFLAPVPGGADRRAAFGPGYPATAGLLYTVANDGRSTEITEAERAQARRDLAYWGATTVVVPASERHADALRETLDALVGPGRRVEDVWLWDVRDVR